MRIMTMSRNYMTFLWFLLIVMFEDVVSTGVKGENNKLMTNLPKIAKSIFINGGRVNWNDWAQRNIKNEYFVGNDIDAKTMVTFVKCEIACLIHTSIDSIIHNKTVKPCSNKFKFIDHPETHEVEACALEKHNVIEYLKELNRNIKLAIDRLLQMVERYPNLRTGESHFTRTLLDAYLYVESFSYLEIRFTSTLDNTSRIPDTVKALQILQNMDRVLLQIMNLNGQFALEYCYPNDNNENGVGGRDPNAELKDFLKGNDLPDTSSSKSLFNMGTSMLEKCMVGSDDDETEDRGLDFCIKYVKTAKIGRKYGSPPTEYETMDLLFEAVKYSYHAPTIYEYMLAIYRVILKLIYLKTREEWISLDETWCEGIISKLKLMHCPLNIIDHFQTLLHIKRDWNELDSKVESTVITVTKFFQDKFNAIESVKINDPCYNDMTIFSESWKNIHLSDLMYILVDHKMFEQFWRVLNFLYKDFAKKSSMTYDMSLNLFTGALVKSPIQYEKDTICNPIIKLFNKINLSETRPLKFQNNIKDFFNELEVGMETSRGVDNDLFKMYLTARIQLDNFNKLKFENVEMLIRILNLILNMFDNYTIKKFVGIHNQKFAFRNKYDIKEIDKQEQNTQINKNKLFKFPGFLENVKQSCFGSRKSDYDFAKLTGKEVIDKGSLGTKVSFDWQGEIKNIVKIQSDLSKTMLNVQDLVDYQRLCFKMLLYVFFETWLVRFEEKFQNQAVIDINMYDQSLKDLNKTSKTLFGENYMQIPFEMFAIYEQYYSLKLNLYSQIGCGVYSGRKMVEVVKKEIMGPMAELLGFVVSDNPDIIVDIQNFLNIDKANWNTTKEGKYFTLCTYWNKIIDKFLNNFKNVYFQRIPDSKYTFYFNIVYTF